MGFDHLPENLRKICDGTRVDLDPQVAMQFKAYCEQNKFPKAESQSSLSAEPPTKSKSWLIDALNFGSAMAKWIAAGRPVRTKKEIKRLYAICKACPQFQDDFCGKCNCRCIETGFLVNKLALKTEVCPDGLWE